MAPFYEVAGAAGGLRRRLPAFPDTHPPLMVRIQPQTHLDSGTGGLGVAQFSKKVCATPVLFGAELVSRILQERVQ